ncbi:MAG: hypothetical protein H7222_13715 [Methylotenera sp.]|nr:hypothetical protein [Oligoflexia bacterium]
MNSAHAGVFTTPHFLAPGASEFGVEPEITLSNGAGIAANLRYTYGLTDLNNFTAIVGTGSGPRQFRAGGNFTFDLFPDIEAQPGIGLATQALYYRLKPSEQVNVMGQLDLTATPYIHKTFINPDGTEIEPFLAIPFGLGFSGGQYKAITSAAVGTIIKSSPNLRYVLELGININHSESYVSGGIAFYP